MFSVVYTHGDVLSTVSSRGASGRDLCYRAHSSAYFVPYWAPFESASFFPRRDVIPNVHRQEEAYLEVLLEWGSVSVFDCNHAFQSLVIRVVVGVVSHKFDFLYTEGLIFWPARFLQFVQHSADTGSHLCSVDGM